ncbi:MAG: type IV pilin N-terminal domain-containing protein [Methanocorpusculum sp.]|nr:type IV pilin N-terminal domain-containing protein [Methanocorpusculum sp.]
MKKDSKKDSAVSPVIGTILLVAITVVLVAIISAVVMGMTGNVGTAHVVGLKVTTDTTDKINVVFTGGDYAKVSAIEVTGGTVTSSTTDPTIDAAKGPTLGTIYVLTLTNNDGLAHEYNIVGTIDGKQEIIWTGTLTVTK